MSKGIYILAVIIIALAFLSGKHVEGLDRDAKIASLKESFATRNLEVSQSYSAALLKLQQDQQRLAEEQASISQKHYVELTNVRKTTTAITSDLALANSRLSVRIATNPASAGSAVSAGTGVDDGTGARADLHPEDAADIFAVTGDADKCRVKLTALQAVERNRQLGAKNSGLPTGTKIGTNGFETSTEPQ